MIRARQEYFKPSGFLSDHVQDSDSDGCYCRILRAGPGRLTDTAVTVTGGGLGLGITVLRLTMTVTVTGLWQPS